MIGGKTKDKICIRVRNFFLIQCNKEEKKNRNLSRISKKKKVCFFVFTEKPRYKNFQGTGMYNEGECTTRECITRFFCIFIKVFQLPKLEKNLKTRC